MSYKENLMHLGQEGMYSWFIIVKTYTVFTANCKANYPDRIQAAAAVAARRSEQIKRPWTVYLKEMPALSHIKDVFEVVFFT